MATICFVHDAPLVEDTASGLVYSQGFRYEVWQRYLEVFDSIIVCTRMRRSPHPPGMGRSSGNKVKFQPASAYKGPLSLLVDFPTIYRQVTHAVSQADAVVLRLPSILGSIGYLAARQTGTKYLIELVGSPQDSYSGSGRFGRLIAPLMSFVTRHIVRHASHSIYVTESHLQKHYPTRGESTAISNVEIDTSRPPTIRTKPSTTVRIGSSGRVDVPYKGYSSVISALADLPNVEFQLAGGGDPAELISQANAARVQDQVTFLGMLGRDELFEWLDTLDLYIQPSLTEGLPRALLEAMSRGLPAIASDVGGIPELLSPEFLVRPGDPYALRTKITELVELADFAEIGIANYRRAQDFDARVLQRRRNSFLSAFRNYVLENKTSS